MAAIPIGSRRFLRVPTVQFGFEDGVEQSVVIENRITRGKGELIQRKQHIVDNGRARGMFWRQGKVMGISLFT